MGKEKEPKIETTEDSVVRIVKEKNPELEEKFRKAYELVNQKAESFAEENYETPEKFSIALHEAAYGVMKEAKEKFGETRYNMRDFFEEMDDSNDLEEDTGYSLSYSLLSRYAEKKLEEPTSSFLSNYLKEGAARELLRKDLVPTQLISGPGPRKQSSSVKHLLEELKTKIPESQKEKAIQELRKFNNDLTIIHDYARWEGDNELREKLGLADSEAYEKEKSNISNLFHVVGSNTGKGFGTALTMAISWYTEGK